MIPDQQLLETFLKLTKNKAYVTPLRAYGKAAAYTLKHPTACYDKPFYGKNGTGMGVVFTHNLLAIDVDSKYENPGDYKVLTRCLEAVLGVCFKDLYTVRTPSGGRHIYFLVPDELTHKNAFLYSGAAQPKKQFFVQTCWERVQAGQLAWGDFNRMRANGFTLNFDVRNGSTSMLMVAPGSVTNKNKARFHGLELTARNKNTDTVVAQQCRDEMKTLENGGFGEDGMYVFTHQGQVVEPAEYGQIVLPTISEDVMVRLARMWGADPDTFTETEQKAWDDTSRVVSKVDVLLGKQRFVDGAFTYSRHSSSAALWDVEKNMNLAGLRGVYDVGQYHAATYTPTGSITTVDEKGDVTQQWVRGVSEEQGEEAANSLHEAVERVKHRYGIGFEEYVASARFACTTGLVDDVRAPMKHVDPDGVFVYEDGTTRFGDYAASTKLIMRRDEDNPVVLSNLVSAPVMAGYGEHHYHGEMVGVLIPTLKGCGGNKVQRKALKERLKAAKRNNIDLTHMPLSHGLCPVLEDKSGRHRAGAHISVDTPFIPVENTTNKGWVSESRVQSWVKASGVERLLRVAPRVTYSLLPVNRDLSGASEVLLNSRITYEAPGFVPVRKRPSPKTKGWKNKDGAHHVGSYKNYRFVLGRFVHHALKVEDFILLVRTLGLDYDTATGARLDVQALVADCVRIYQMVAGAQLITKADEDPYSMRLEDYGATIGEDTEVKNKKRVGSKKAWRKRREKEEDTVLAANPDGSHPAMLGSHPETQKRMSGSKPEKIKRVGEEGQHYGVVYDVEKVTAALLKQVGVPHAGYAKVRNALMFLLALDGTFQNLMVTADGALAGFDHVHEMVGMTRNMITVALKNLRRAGILTVTSPATTGKAQKLMVNPEFRDTKAERMLGEARDKAAANRSADTCDVPVTAVYDREKGEVITPYDDGTWETWMRRRWEDEETKEYRPLVVSVYGALLFCSHGADVTIGWDRYQEDVKDHHEPGSKHYRARHHRKVSDGMMGAVHNFMAAFSTVKDFTKSLKERGWLLDRPARGGRFGDNPFGVFAGLTLWQCRLIFHQLTFYRTWGSWFNTDLVRFVFEMCPYLGVSLVRADE